MTNTDNGIDFGLAIDAHIAANHPAQESTVSDTDLTFNLDECTEIARAFDAGNYANAYETNDIEACDLDELSEHQRAAFVLGFFSSYTLDEIGSDRDLFDECYWSHAGRYVVNVAKYTDDRADEYAAE